MISSSQHTSYQSKTTIDKTPPSTSETQKQEVQQQHQSKQRSHKITRIDVENDLEKESFNQERKHDWVINDNDNMNQNNNDINIIVPSFIRLFVITRIIDKYIKKNKYKKRKKSIIKKLANVFKENKTIELLVICIVTRLINEGIKKYMSKYYNEKKQANIIEDIFNKIILKQFCQEYNEMIKYGGNNNDNYYKNLLFNSTDLMNKIFQYLEWGCEFDGDLYSCSLVSSHWLYHSWNPNSVYYIDFDSLVDDNISNIRKWTRIWHRLYNVKSVGIYLNFGSEDSKAALAIMNKLSMFRKVEKVNMYASGNEVNKSISLVKPIMSRCKDRIKYCAIRIKSNSYNTSSSHFEACAPAPLRLPKAQYVEIGDLLFYRQWTNECAQLELYVKNISKDWCKFVIENCDCSGINTLILHEVTFDNKSINKVILKQFALKFYNLKTFEIFTVIDDKIDDNLLLFWQLLKPIISKNKTNVKLEVRIHEEDEAIFLSERMDEKDLTIDKLIIDCIDGDDLFDDTIKFIQERDNHGLNHLAIEYPMCENLLNELKCKSITTFELNNGDIKFVNPLLEWKMIVQKQIFVIIDVCGYYNDYNNDDKVLSLFTQIYENVHKLFLQQIAFDSKIKFRNVKDSKVFDLCLSQYSSYFENLQFLSKYNSPNCSNHNLCLPRDKPYTYFYVHDSKLEDEWQRYFVFGATNIQMK